MGDVAGVITPTHENRVQRIFEPPLGTSVEAYRAECDCGFTGPPRSSRFEARQDARAHYEPHPSPRSAVVTETTSDSAWLPPGVDTQGREGGE